MVLDAEVVDRASLSGSLLVLLELAPCGTSNDLLLRLRLLH